MRRGLLFAAVFFLAASSNPLPHGKRVDGECYCAPGEGASIDLFGCWCVGGARPKPTPAPAPCPPPPKAPKLNPWAGVV